MPDSTCICPRTDPRECMRVRSGRDLRFLLDGDYGQDDDEECQCGCHAEHDQCEDCGEPLGSFGECGACDWMEGEDA